MNDPRLIHEIEHGKFLSRCGAGEVWNWETPAGRLRWARRVKMLTSPLTPGMEVLELGCGTGYFTKEIVKTGVRLTAIDISPELIKIAKKEVNRADNVIFSIQNAYAMNYKNERFDAVVGSSVLHHLDVAQALRECFRVLKPCGVICFTEPNMLNPQIVLQKNIPFLKKRLGDSPDETAFFRWRIQRLLRQAGFEKTVVLPFDWLHPSVPQSLIPAVSRLGGFLEKFPFLREFSGSLFVQGVHPPE
jgi:ubiquinone/menaquinone biosynthesis C-methylase UbiE